MVFNSKWYPTAPHPNIMSLCFQIVNPALKELGRGKLEVVLFTILLNGVPAERAVRSPQLTIDGLRKLLGKVRLDGREKAPHLHLLLLLVLVLLLPEMHHCAAHPPCTWHSNRQLGMHLQQPQTPHQTE